MAWTATPYPNEVVETAINDFLVSTVELRGYCTLDNSLAENPGMIKVIRRYKKTGQAVNVDIGEDVTDASGTRMAVAWEDNDYTAKVMQQEFQAFDEDVYTDPKFVDVGIQSIGEALWNNLQAEIADEWKKTTNMVFTGEDANENPNPVTFDTFVDAVAELNLEDSEESGLVAFCSPAQKAALRKTLKDDLKYVEGYSRTGYIGHICGIPLVTSKLIDDAQIIITDSKAVRVFTKQGVKASQDRDNAHRETIYVGNMCYIAALVDESKCVLIQVGPEESL